eukprot:TRINITY_DN8182_c0_g1_i1.p1 TRINITY_DN8182_c0_g1~~TRINITY_DN8182_c0_g1_i1.p1  ORF type:complete len:431 (+),score=70.90 TRINITY_DN8182_c0_g1_i1:164-1456(+)
MTVALLSPLGWSSTPVDAARRRPPRPAMSPIASPRRSSPAVPPQRRPACGSRTSSPTTSASTAGQTPRWTSASPSPSPRASPRRSSPAAQRAQRSSRRSAQAPEPSPSSLAPSPPSPAPAPPPPTPEVARPQRNVVARSASPSQRPRSSRVRGRGRGRESSAPPVGGGSSAALATCAICLEPLAASSDQVAVLKQGTGRACRHFFHRRCAARCSHEAGCPLCRASFDRVVALPHPKKGERFLQALGIHPNEFLEKEAFVEAIAASLAIDEDALAAALPVLTDSELRFQGSERFSFEQLVGPTGLLAKVEAHLRRSQNVEKRGGTQRRCESEGTAPERSAADEASPRRSKRQSRRRSDHGSAGGGEQDGRAAGQAAERDVAVVEAEAAVAVAEKWSQAATDLGCIEDAAPRLALPASARAMPCRGTLLLLP